jgi:hypothetical protein
MGELTDAETEALERPAWLHLIGWHGHTKTEVRIVFNGESAKRYRVRLTERTKLPGRDRWGNVGDIILVPKTAVTLDGAPPTPGADDVPGR